MTGDISSVKCDAEFLKLELVGGGLLSRRLALFPILAQASPSELSGWTLVDDLHGVCWPELRDCGPLGLVNTFDLLQEDLYNGALDRLQLARWQFGDLSKYDQELVSLWRLESDMNSGGFLEFYSNWGPAVYERALDSLQIVGAHRTADLVRRMDEVVGHHYEAVHEEDNRNLYALVTDQESRRITELESRYWTDSERLSKLVVLHYLP
ncbi:DMP19 family protein [Subtercola endophyticus]|uniref:DMP19 family protein n=1 Tax=Subtercola endophyticus TaxID=2895559 RepID=UPI001E49103C|nr:DUF4375 domain-containing protein [Subtercola endophyticus]UFS60401.1 DUF4375 domain-containing protein [Subtercola endophyticus]